MNAIGTTVCRLATVAAAASLTACAGLAPKVPMPAPAQVRAACAPLAGVTIPASVIGLPSGDARIASASLVPAAAQRVEGGATRPASPEFCKVLGTIAPLDPAAQPIRFQANLPLAWNGKALQYGGGGMNGVLITGLAPLRDANPDDPLPIARGYLTYGTDSGHDARSFPPSEPGSFALNDEMLVNFTYASYKKVKDVTVAIARRAYGQAPARTYYFGGSEGGREGLTVAQRFPADYDGVVSVVPVINWTGLFHAFVRNELPQFHDWLDAAKIPLVARSVADACDALDGLADGVVNDYLGCQAKVDLAPLRCPGGTDAGAHCLSDTELKVLRTASEPYVFPFPLANGQSTYPGWLWGHEDAPDQGAAHLARWMSGKAPPAIPPNPRANAIHWFYGSNWIRYAIARDGRFDVRTYDPAQFRARVQQTSALIDSTDPDLAPFFGRGGKLIIRENAADRAQSPMMGMLYHDAVVARLGRAAAESGMRLYVSPASTHGGGSRATGGGAAVPTAVDLLDVLDRWVTAGEAPGDSIVQTLKSPVPPFAVQASRPMCRYPAYPRYVGGNRKLADSYRCTPAAR